MTTTLPETADLTPQQTEYIAGLRELADWLEAHPAIDMGYGQTLYAAGINTPADLAAVITAFGSCRKAAYGEYIGVEKDFGPHTISATTTRGQVCEKVVTVEEVEVEGPDPEAVAALPVVTYTETRETVSWTCPESLLALGREVSA